MTLVDFRNHERSVLVPEPCGLTALVGPNGAGKTAVLEAIGYAATLGSFRGAPRDALVRTGRERAIVRVEAVRAGQEALVEAEAGRDGRGRALVNRKPVRRQADLSLGLVVSVLAPEDRELVEGAPAARRAWLDDALSTLRPRLGELRATVERLLRQRAVLLRRAGGRLERGAAATLEVLDEQLGRAGELLVEERRALVEEVDPLVRRAYRVVADGEAVPKLAYAPSWSGSLVEALAAARARDLRQQATTVGPHRDDVGVTLGGRAARGTASKGEARALGLALRLGVHELAARRLGEPPVLLLDDVLAELDPVRAARLLSELPVAQALLSATRLPHDAPAHAAVVRVEAGSLVRDHGAGSGGVVDASGDVARVGEATRTEARGAAE